MMMSWGAGNLTTTAYIPVLHGDDSAGESLGRSHNPLFTPSSSARDLELGKDAGVNWRDVTHISR